MNDLAVTLIIECSKCGGLLLAKADQKTRTCPHCGLSIALYRARKIASANSANEASMILRKLKLEGATHKKG